MVNACKSMNLKGSRAIAQSGKTDKTEVHETTTHPTCSSCSRPCWLVSPPAHGQATTGSIGPDASTRLMGCRFLASWLPSTSPMLQGTRTAVTSESGDYLIPLLPPGTYTVVVRARRVSDASSGHSRWPARTMRGVDVDDVARRRDASVSRSLATRSRSSRLRRSRRTSNRT